MFQAKLQVQFAYNYLKILSKAMVNLFTRVIELLKIVIPMMRKQTAMHFEFKL